MDKDQLSRMQEYVGSDFLETARRLLPGGKTQEFYVGYGAGMTQAMKVVKQFTDANLLAPKQMATLTELFGALCIAAGEQEID